MSHWESWCMRASQWSFLLSLRVVEIAGEPWFIAKDVCDAQGLPPNAKNGSYQDHIRRLDANEKSNFKLGLRGKAPLIVSESGLYSLVLRSRKPEAHAFRKWVTSVVLPAIRRDGAYIKGEEAMDEDQLIAAAMASMQRKIARLTPQAHGESFDALASNLIREKIKKYQTSGEAINSSAAGCCPKQSE